MARAPYSLKPRGKKGILWLRFTKPDGREVFCSTGTTDWALANEWASGEHAKAYRVARLGEKPRRSWREAVTRWLDDHQKKRSLKKDLHNLRWLEPHFGGLMLDEIDGDRLDAVNAARKSEPRDKRRRSDGEAHSAALTSQATADKMLALIRSVLRSASSWGWLDKVPAIKLTGSADKEDYRWLTHAEAAALHDALPDHLQAPYEFALATGWREQNVLRLEWTRVDMVRKVVWVAGSEAKGKRAIGAPLNRDALRILKGQEGKNVHWVFPAPPVKRKGKPTRKPAPYIRANNHGFKSAQARAGIAPLTWHDLRHTWASWHVMAGTSLRSLMELGGWRSYKSVLRYAHLSPEHLAADAARVEGLARKLHGKSKTSPRKTATPGYTKKPAKTRKGRSDAVLVH